MQEGLEQNSMITRPYIVSMARYNEWMNGKVYEAAGRLPAEEIARDRGAFFKSILGTLNHLRFADLIWMGRFKEGKPRISDPVADLASLRAARLELDREILEWAGTVGEEWLRLSFTFRTLKGDAEFTNPNWVLVTHMFNHQTHHRGQITTLLTQAGEDVGATDFSAMPGVGEL
jgi:uncharacterized damage-inducible protein DinB